MSSWVRDMNVKQSTELGTGNFRKPRRSSVMPPELMIQKYKEIIKTKEDLERKSLVSEEQVLKGLKTTSIEDDHFDFSPSIPKKTKHYSLMKNTLKKNQHNAENLLDVSNNNPFLQYNNMTQSENPHSNMAQSDNFSLDSGSLKNDNVLIESIPIPVSKSLKPLDDATGDMVMSVSMDMEEEKNCSKTKHETNPKNEENNAINGRSSVKKPFSHFRKTEENAVGNKNENFGSANLFLVLQIFFFF